MSLSVKLENLYADREITGEAFLQPYKACNQFIHKMVSEDNCLSKATRLISQIALYLFFGPLVLVGMMVKCLNVSQVKAYNDKVKQKLENREVLDDYPRQLDSVFRLPIEQVIAWLDRSTEAWERGACNIMRYEGGNEVLIQPLEKNPRWKIPEGAVRPFAF